MVCRGVERGRGQYKYRESISTSKLIRKSFKQHFIIINWPHSDRRCGAHTHIINSKVKHIIKSTSNAPSKQQKKTCMRQSICICCSCHCICISGGICCIYASSRCCCCILWLLIALLIKSIKNFFKRINNNSAKRGEETGRDREGEWEG